MDYKTLEDCRLASTGMDMHSVMLFAIVLITTGALFWILNNKKIRHPLRSGAILLAVGITPLVLTGAIANASCDNNLITDNPSLISTAVSVPDSTSGHEGQVQTINLISNDTPSNNASFILNSITLSLPASPIAGSIVSDDKKSITVPNEGRYTVDNTGILSFSPAHGFVGRAKGVNYSIKDSSGAIVRSAYNPYVTRGLMLVDDTSTGLYRQTQTLNILSNDTPSEGADFDLSTLQLELPNPIPVNSQITNENMSVYIRGEGTYELSSDGTLIFTPRSDFTGTATPIFYTISDTNSISSKGSIAIEVTHNGVARNDSSYENGSSTTNLLANDTPSPGATFDESTLIITQGPPGATISSDGKSAQINGNVFTISGSDIIYSQMNSTQTDATLSYQVTDTNGYTIDATFTIDTAWGCSIDHDPHTIEVNLSGGNMINNFAEDFILEGLSWDYNASYIHNGFVIDHGWAASYDESSDTYFLEITDTDKFLQAQATSSLNIMYGYEDLCGNWNDVELRVTDVY